MLIKPHPNSKKGKTEAKRKMLEKFEIDPDHKNKLIKPHPNSYIANNKGKEIFDHLNQRQKTLLSKYLRGSVILDI